MMHFAPHELPVGGEAEDASGAFLTQAQAARLHQAIVAELLDHFSDARVTGVALGKATTKAQRSEIAKKAAAKRWAKKG